MELFYCFVPLLIVLAVVIWLTRARPGANVARATPAWSDDAFRDTLSRLLGVWISQGRLPRETGAQVLMLLREDRERLAQQPAQAPADMAVPAAPAIAADLTPAPADMAIPAAPATPAPPTLAAAPAPDAAAAPSLPAPAAPALTAPEQPAIAAAPPAPSLGEQLWGGLLALRTRQTLLFLGAFLLVVSALILVVFNWASFPPLLQFALLAAVCGGLWGGGYWMSYRWGLKGAGAGLRLVGAALTPVVAFSLSRPGLLDLAPRGGWLLASALSLPIYALAARRLRHVVYAAAACLAAASAALAALSFAAPEWLPVALALLLAGYLPLARWLKPRAPELAAGPVWVAHGGLPIALVWSIMPLLDRGGDLAVLSATLWAAAGFYLLAAWLEQRPIWAWAAAALAPLGLLAGLAAADAEALWWALAPAIMALGYLGLAVWLDPRAHRYALPAYLGAAGLALLSLPFAESWESARLTLPLLAAAGAGVVAAAHRGRFGWLGETGRLAVATLGLALAAGLLPFWALALLDLTQLRPEQRGLALLPLAALAFAAARWWPGRLQKPYDLALQVIGALIALGAGAATLIEISTTTAVAGMAALTAVWAFQTALRRHSLWAALALGCAPLAAALALDRLLPNAQPAYWYALGLLFAGGYALGGTLLRRSAWRCLTWPGLGWGAMIGAGMLLATGVEIQDGGVFARHVVVVGALAGLLALTAALWRRAWPGYLVAALLAADVLLAADGGFLLGWQPTLADFGYILCGLTLALALIGQALRQIVENREPPRGYPTENRESGSANSAEAHRSVQFLNSQFSILNSYAVPYEVVGFALLTAAPLPAMADARHACLTWIAMALLYALAAWRYRLPWVAAPALVAADMALLRGADWLGSGGRVADVGVLLLAAAWAQGLLGLWAHRRERATAPPTIWQELSTPAYLVTLLSGLGALALASGASDALAVNALGLAALAALIATLERGEELAWGALALLALGLGALHHALGVSLPWSMAWGVAEALGLCLIGWLMEWRMKNEEVRTGGDQASFSILHSSFFIWYRPLWLGPLLAGAILVALLLVAAPARGELPALTFGLATLALLLATLAVRRRATEYAYAAGAALVAAGLCQIYDWGFRQPQWYAVPAGLYLMALAEGLRRFQRQRGVAQVIESGAAVLMFGTTLGQSLRAEGLASQGYAAWLCVESLVLLGYGTLRQLRAPFFGGALFFVIGVLWLSVDPLLAANKWVLLGILGLLLVGAYVLLERRQEQLARAGRAWVERLRGWS